MDSTDTHPNSARLDEAADWHAIVRDGSETPSERAAFDEWRSDPRNQRAFDDTEALCGTMRDVAEFQDMALEAERRYLASPAGSKQRWFQAIVGAITSWQFVSAAGFAASVVLIVGVMMVAPRIGDPVYETQTALSETIQLPDGSTIDLAPASRVSVEYSREVRRVSLTAGEAFFDVVNTDDRPFIVDTNSTEIRVLGTSFNVKQAHTGVLLAVAHGVVRVVQKSTPVSPEIRSEDLLDSRMVRELTAGEQVIARPDEGIEEVASVDPEQAGAWRNGFLSYTDSALVDVIADANRYSELPIVLASTDLNTLRLNAGFKTSRIDQMLSGIEGLLPVTVEREPSRIVIKPKDVE